MFNGEVNIAVIAVLFSPVIMGIAVAFFVLFLMTRGRKEMLKICAVFFIVAFIGGLTFYTVGYMPRDAEIPDILYAALRGLFSTGRMFSINDDYSYILGSPDAAWFIGSIVSQISFWLCHVLALGVFVSALMAIFGRRVIDYMRMKFRGYDTCYMILGVDWRALTLGKHIALRDGSIKRPDPKRLVVYICENITNEFRAEAADFGGVALETGETSFAARLISAGLAAKRRVKHVKIIVMPGDETRAPGLLLQTMKCAKDYKLDSKRFEFYLLAESEWVRNRAWALAKEYECTLHATGEAELAARKMIISLPPWNKTTLEKGLSALILGFGETGEEALRRLVMNGQFPGTKMRAVVVDKNIEAIKGRFTRRCPSIQKCCGIDYYSCDFNSEAFYELLDKISGEVNYIVIAMGSDAVNLNAAQSLREHFERAGMSQPPTAVFLRSVCPEDGEDKTDKRGKERRTEEDKKIVFLSRSEHIFTEAFVIHEELDRMAMEVNAVYDNIPEGSHEEILNAWRKCSPFYMESNRAAADFIDGILALAGATEEKPFDPDKTDKTELDMMALAEHYRWYAFYCVSGWTPMSIEEMNRRFKDMSAAGDDITGCRKNDVLRRHACMAEWEELDAVSARYNELMIEGGKPEKHRNFKNNDIYNVTSIPRLIRARDKTKQSEANK